MEITTKAALRQGFVWLVERDDSSKWDDGRGYHGDDAPPCDGEYLCDWEKGFIVLTEGPKVECVKGWSAGPAAFACEPGWYQQDAHSEHVDVFLHEVSREGEAVEAVFAEYVP